MSASSLAEREDPPCPLIIARVPDDPWVLEMTTSCTDEDIAQLGGRRVCFYQEEFEIRRAQYTLLSLDRPRPKQTKVGDRLFFGPCDTVGHRVRYYSLPRIDKGSFDIISCVEANEKQNCKTEYSIM